eukprot:scaffold80544_cov68-Cyclotella_meneghiniana.AAC.1
MAIHHLHSPLLRKPNASTTTAPSPQPAIVYSLLDTFVDSTPPLLCLPLIQERSSGAISPRNGKFWIQTLGSRERGV